MTLLISIAAVALVYHLWLRVKGLESAIIGLIERVSRLEERRAQAPPAAPEPAAKLTEARPAAPYPPLMPSSPPPAAAPHVSMPSMRSILPAAAERTVADNSHDESLETRIGSRWLLYIGVVAIVVGVSYFEKLAIENRWIGETARVIQGAIAGLVLIAAGLRFVKAGYQAYGRVLSGCGIALLYVSTYAAFNFYHLVSRPVAFALMSVVTAMAAWLADRQRSQSLAIVAVGGGFATPFLLPAAIDTHVALFTYEAILIGGTMFLARQRDWPLLNIISYVFTVLTIAHWAGHFYDESKYLSTELFLTAFCLMYLYILRESRRSTHPAAEAAWRILWTAPFGYYLASVAILAEHSAALLAYLIILSLVGVIATFRFAFWTRLAFWAAVAVPLLLWSDAHANPTWLAPGLMTWTAVYLLSLAALLEATLRDDEGTLGAAEIAVLHLNGLAAYLGAYLLIEPVRAGIDAPLAAAFAAWHGILAAAIFKRHREQALHFIALAFTLLTIAVALQFRGPSITSAWAAEGAVIIWLALRERREWLRAAGVLLFAAAINRLMELQFTPPHAGERLLFNGRAACGLFIVVLAYLVAFAHQRLGSRAARKAETGIGLVAAKLLVLSVAVSEISAYWTLHVRPPFALVSQIVDACLIVGAATMWMGLQRRQEWIRGIGGAMVAGGGLLLLSAQFEAVPAGYVALLNNRAAAGVFIVLVLYLLAELHRRRGSHLPGLSVNLAVLTIAASMFTLSLLTSEINAFWAGRDAGEAKEIARGGLQAIAWAGVGSFLIWRGLLTRGGWMRALGAAVLVLAVARLLGVQLADPSQAYTTAISARVMAATFVIAVLYGLAHIYRISAENSDRIDADYAPHTTLVLLANVVTLTLLTSEISAYWRVRDLRYALPNASTESHFAREMMLSVTWAAYATLLIVVGLRKRYAPIRYFAIAIFVVTIVKVFAVDLADLDRIYRVLSVIGLGLALLLSSYLYQRSTPRGKPFHQ